MITPEEHKNVEKAFESISHLIDWDAVTKTPLRILPPTKTPDKVEWTMFSFDKKPSTRYDV
jgi:hypothetical protein